MQVNWTWKESFRFALAGMLLSEEDYKKSSAERFGAFFLRAPYKVIDYVSRHIKKPFAILLFTILAALFAVVVFYKIPALIILGKVFPSRLVRFMFFVYVELIVFGMGCRAIGRFNNRDLIKLWKAGKLAAIFPGDKRYK
jgi:hypothetical protein